MPTNDDLPTAETFLKEVDQFIAETGMPETVLGRAAVGNSKFLPRLRDAVRMGTGDVKLGRVKQIRAFMNKLGNSKYEPRAARDVLTAKDRRIAAAIKDDSTTERDAIIRIWRNRGVALAAIGREFGISRERVRQIIEPGVKAKRAGQYIEARKQEAAE